MSALFTSFRVGALTLPNRLVIAPMCQYSAVDGCMTDWHLIHLGHLALSGAGLLTIEATAVLPEGRITYADVGLWHEAAEAAIARTLESVRRWSPIAIAIQLAHAGRKASTEVPWKGGRQIPPGQAKRAQKKMDLQKISYRKSGGFAGISKGVDITVSTLPPGNSPHSGTIPGTLQP